MVTHIVFWNFKETVHTQEAYAGMRTRLLALQGAVPGLCSVQVGRGFNGWDVALITTHTTAADLDAYQIHPAHMAVKDFVQGVVSQRVCCDFETEDA